VRLPASVPACAASTLEQPNPGTAKMLSLAVWRAAQGQFAPSHQAYRHTSATGRATGGPRRGFVPQAQAA